MIVIGAPERVEDVARRSIDFRWPVSEIEDNFKGHGVVNVELSVYHSSHHKQLCASVNPITVFDSGWTTKSFSLASGPRWSFSQPCVRYSRKALDVFASRAVEALTEAVASGHEIGVLFGGEL